MAESDQNNVVDLDKAREAREEARFGALIPEILDELESAYGPPSHPWERYAQIKRSLEKLMKHIADSSADSPVAE